MRHGDRIKVVRGIHIRVLKQYPNSLLFGGVYGSTAIGRDTEFSDIEMLYILPSGVSLPDKQFLYRDIVIEVNFLSIDTIEKWLREPDLLLPIRMGNLANLQLLTGEAKQRDEIIERYRDLTDEQVQSFFSLHGAMIGYESFNKIRSLERRAGKRNLSIYKYEVLSEMASALALINRLPIGSGYYGAVNESFEFPLLPVRYREVAEMFRDTDELKEVIVIGKELFDQFESFLTQQNLLLSRMQTLDEINW
ncbi:helix-hairpin-helix domain-containing protein [Effusibacillus dendaii]|uniref:Nucleotidyltransferase domain-containing protein n=1 Tax=Effusibacillus dendaii TaxID=2743772 RepID=A0A7I8DAA4_9BACL|nr:hypothetical protein [Effusibacillus dendaii]BCJ85460.1 hypothetical protein skT53_04450 [Effusibacillus dendaii]